MKFLAITLGESIPWMAPVYCLGELRGGAGKARCAKSELRPHSDEANARKHLRGVTAAEAMPQWGPLGGSATERDWNRMSAYRSGEEGGA